MDRLSSLDGIVSRYTRWIDEHRDRMLYFFSDEFCPKIRHQVDNLEKLLGASPPARILDLACGTGCQTIEFARRGYDMIGLDCTPAMLEIAKQMAAQKQVEVSWVLGDMRTIEYEEEMNYVLLRDVVFGIFEPKEDHELVVRGVARALKPGGRFLLEVYNKEFAMRHGVENRYRYDADTDRFVADATEEDGKLDSISILSEHELRHMLTNSGLAIVATDGVKWTADPAPPPWRVDFIVAQKT